MAAFSETTMAGSERRVLVAMSGGVDSAVAAVLLLEQGYEVTGVFLCLGSQGGGGARRGTCCCPEDAEDARRVARALGIPLIRLPVSGAFGPIIRDFAGEYARGRTPNPCICCNASIKFGLLFDLAEALGARYVATGHHARIVRRAGEPAIARARGRKKDQSYVLVGVERRRLARILLPIGEVDGKEEVRRIARRMSLAVHDKPDSQEVCFVPDEGYPELVWAHAPEGLRPGRIVDSRGQVLGKHQGYACFTIGQRRGLGVAAGHPFYVTKIDPETATVTVGRREELMGSYLAASRANWHCDLPVEFDATVQVRSGHDGAAGTVRVTAEGTFEVVFDEPVEAITPGQAAAVYRGDRLLGGGWIRAGSRTKPSSPHDHDRPPAPEGVHAWHGSMKTSHRRSATRPW